MEAKRRWATGVVVLVAIAAGAGGGAYLWKEAFPTEAAAPGDGGVVADAATDARARKSKSAKKGGRGRPRAGPNAGGPNAGPNAGPKPVQGGGGGAAGGGGVADDSQVDDSVDESPEVFEPPFRGRGPAGPTYEAAIASNKQEITMGGKAEPDLTDAQLTGPMRSGGFVGECGAPDSMKVTVKVAIKMGRAAGVSVSTSPPDPDIAGCIDRYVRTFTWPSSSKMDSFTTTY